MISYQSFRTKVFGRKQGIAVIVDYDEKATIPEGFCFVTISHLFFEPFIEKSRKELSTDDIKALDILKHMTYEEKEKLAAYTVKHRQVTENSGELLKDFSHCFYAKLI